MEEKNEMQTQPDGLTFSEIFCLLKKGIVLLTICLIIGVILVTSCLLVMREVVGTTSYETEITFSSASISSQQEFNPSTTVNTLVKSDTIISRALTALKYSSEDQQNLINKGLAGNLSAYTKDAKDDTQGIAYPYKVTISLKKLGGKALSKAQSAALLEEITKQVILELINAYKFDITFDEISNIDYTQYNYLQVYDKLDNSLNSVMVFSNTLNKDALNYKKNGVAIKTIISKYEAIYSELNVVKQKLITNKIKNEGASSSELDYATYNANYYTQKATQLATRITDYAQLLKDTKPDITVTTSGVTVDALNKYYELVEVYNELQNEYAVISAKAVEWEEIKTAYTSANITDESVKTQFNAIVASYNTTSKELNNIIDAYNEDNYASNLVAQTQAVGTTKDSAISKLVILLADVVVIALIVVIVVFVEKRKESKKAACVNAKQ